MLKAFRPGPTPHRGCRGGVGQRAGARVLLGSRGRRGRNLQSSLPKQPISCLLLAEHRTSNRETEAALRDSFKRSNKVHGQPLCESSHWLAARLREIPTLYSAKVPEQFYPLTEQNLTNPSMRESWNQVPAACRRPQAPPRTPSPLSPISVRETARENVYNPRTPGLLSTPNSSPSAPPVLQG